MDLVGKTVVVVGGFGGIGFEVCKCLLQSKIKSLGIFDQRENPSKLAELGNNDVDITFCKMDITKKPEIEQAYNRFIRKAGPIDLVINSAGIMDDRKVRLTVEINLIGLMESTLTAISHMNKLDGGKGGFIVNISSVLGIEPGTATAIYSGSKFGVVGFTKSLANDFYYQQNGVKLMVICPGITITPLIENLVGIKDTFDYSKDITSFISRAKSQTAEECAKNIIKSIQQAENGSIFICDLGELRSVELAKLWEIQFK